MSALDTVQDYVTDSRVLLQDTLAPYRYDDPSLLTALNVTLLEARRLRPDLFVFFHHEKVPFFTAVDTTEVRMEGPFRLALVLGMVSHALSRDQEDVQDARATAFMGMFENILLGLRKGPVTGGTPGGNAAQGGRAQTLPGA